MKKNSNKSVYNKLIKIYLPDKNNKSNGKNLKRCNSNWSKYNKNNLLSDRSDFKNLDSDKENLNKNLKKNILKTRKKISIKSNNKKNVIFNNNQIQIKISDVENYEITKNCIHHELKKAKFFCKKLLNFKKYNGYCSQCAVDLSNKGYFIEEIKKNLDDLSFNKNNLNLDTLNLQIKNLLNLINNSKNIIKDKENEYLENNNKNKKKLKNFWYNLKIDIDCLYEKLSKDLTEDKKEKQKFININSKLNKYENYCKTLKFNINNEKIDLTVFNKIINENKNKIKKYKEKIKGFYNMDINFLKLELNEKDNKIINDLYKLININYSNDLICSKICINLNDNNNENNNNKFNSYNVKLNENHENQQTENFTKLIKSNFWKKK